MEITFEKVGNKYVAEFEATADFNLHIERVEQSTLEVYQRGIAEGEYDFAWSAGVGARKVIDYDFGALVYPKYIKVISGSEVLSASVNFNEGGGSGNGNGSSGDNNFKYYKINSSFAITGNIYNYDEPQYLITHMRAQLNGDRYMYGTFAGVVRYFGKQTQNPYIDAFAFSPTVLFIDEEWLTIKSYEDAVDLYPDALPPINSVTEITPEEYWEHFNAE